MTRKIWRGNAQAVRQVDKLTPTLASIGDVFSVTINGKVFSYTAAYADLTEDPTYGWIPSLVAKLASLLTTFGATNPEFGEITWLAVNDPNGIPLSLYAYGPTDGKPVSMSSSATNVSGGLGVGTDETVAGSASANEQQTITIQGTATGGTFTVSYGGTAGTGSVAYNASAATLKTELETIAALSGNVNVTGSSGGPWVVEFKNGLALTDVPLILCDGASLTGANTQTFSKTSIITASGPNWFTADANWSTGTAPADDDDLVFENSAVSCLYGLSNASVTPASITIRASFQGSIGLPRYTGTYPEYRDTALRIGTTGDGSSPSIAIDIGGGAGQGSPLIRLDTGSKQTLLSVTATGRSTEANAAAVNWCGTHASNTVAHTGGSLGIAGFAGETATVLTLTETSTTTSQSSGPVLTLGSGATVGTFSKSGGDCTSEAAITSLTHLSGNMALNGTAAPSAIVLSGGTVTSQTTGVLGASGTITGISKADPAVVTSNGHGLSPGDRVRIADSDMTEVNYLDFVVGVVAANTFQLLAVDSSGYGSAGTTGTWAKLESVQVTGTGVLDFSRSMAARQIAAPLLVYSRNSWIDRAKAVSTLTYPSGTLAVDYRGCSPSDNLGEGLWTRS